DNSETTGTGIATIEDTLAAATEKTEIVKDTIQDSSEKSLSAVEQNKKHDRKGRWTIYLEACLFGFTTLLTPCVFPMIPMTVSFFTKQSKTRAAGIKNAIIYGIAIILIYVFLGAIVTWFFGADALNALSTNVWFNVIFFLLLVIFALSF